jgi:ATP/ADP translocase
MKKKLRNIAAAMGVRPGEGRLAGTFMLYSFLLGLSASIIDVGSYALFLSSFGAASLPWVYIGVGVTLTAGSFIYAWLIKRMSFERFLLGASAFNVLTLTALWIALRVTGYRWLHMALPIWFEVIVFLDVMIYWEYCDRLFDIRQGKRLFGTIRSFQFLAGIIGGLLAATLAGPLGTENLLGIACFVGVMSLLLGAQIRKFWPEELTDDDDEESANEQSIGSMLKSRLTVLIFLFVGVTVLEFYILDNIFYEVAETRYPDDESFARFYGIYSAITGLLGWICLGALTGPIMSRFGLKTSLLVMPIFVLIAVVIAIGAGVFGAPVGVLFWLVVFSKLLDDVLTPAFNESSTDVLYQVLPASSRSRARAISDGIAYPLTAAFTGGLLLLLSGPIGMNFQGLLLILLVVIVGCVVVAWRLPHEYRFALNKALSSRSFGSISDMLGESSGAAAIREGLKDPSAARVLYCLEMLSEVDDSTLGLALVSLLDHPDARVRREALRRMERIEEKEQLSAAVSQSLNSDPEANVRGQALRTMAHMIAEVGIEEVAAYLNSDDQTAPSVFSNLTLGLNLRPFEHLTIRPEVRWDWQDRDNGLDTSAFDDGSDNNQFLVACDFVLTF